MRASGRDRAVINGFLAMAQDAGHDVNAIISRAKVGLGIGTPPIKAYTRAFNEFTDAVPSFRGKLQRLTQMVDAADAGKLAAYNVALANYVESGDTSALAPIQATLKRDMDAMADRHNDPGFADLVAMPPAAPAGSTHGEAAPARPGWSHGMPGYRPSENPNAP